MPLPSAKLLGRIDVQRSSGVLNDFGSPGWGYLDSFVGAVGLNNKDRFLAIRGYNTTSRHCALDLCEISTQSVIDSRFFGDPDFTFTYSTERTSTVMGNSGSLGECFATLGDKAILVTWGHFNDWGLHIVVVWDDGGSLQVVDNDLGEEFDGLIMAGEGAVPHSVWKINDETCYVYFNAQESGQFEFHTVVLKVSVDALGAVTVLDEVSSQVNPGDPAYTTMYQPLWRSQTGTNIDHLAYRWHHENHLAVGTLNMETAVWTLGPDLAGGTVNEFHTAPTTLMAVPYGSDSFILIEPGEKAGWDDDHPGFRYVTYDGSSAGDVLYKDPWDGFKLMMNRQLGYGPYDENVAFTTFQRYGDNHVSIAELHLSGHEVIDIYEHKVQYNPWEEDPDEYGERSSSGENMIPIGNGLFIVGIPGWTEHPDGWTDWEMYYYVFEVGGQIWWERRRQMLSPPPGLAGT